MADFKRLDSIKSLMVDSRESSGALKNPLRFVESVRESKMKSVWNLVEFVESVARILASLWNLGL
ncbi:hypothetical protein CCY99_00580 [Helicobacter sp. 16-1353]|uniref:hypothetical protein n=1 Tax=Helicobacter sp. 16-1353 TaxID=2004996 RepID=UPI000DCBE067|nr:hypothetical protein [Helicobacter sp. 16-1353]RAX55228.1 hypothetical protein CCY99_00580 [Helicobacter sp. 16-1353]